MKENITMATKKKTTEAPETKSLFVRGVTKADGSPWGVRRSNEEMLKVYQDKLVAAQARHAKEIGRIEKKIAYFSAERTGRVAIDPAKAAAAAQEYLAKGMTSDDILAAAEQLRLAAFAVKGKSDEELAAIVNAPSFFTVTPPPVLAAV